MSELLWTRIAFTAIVAYNQQRVIGQRGDSALLWRHSGDLKAFKRLTLNKVCIVGSDTFRTLPPLEGRDLVVVTSKDPASFNIPAGREGAITFESSVSRAKIAAARLSASIGEPEVIVIGGASIYEQMFPFITTILATEIAQDTPESVAEQARVYFPRLSPELWQELWSARTPLESKDDEPAAVTRIFTRVIMK